MSLSVPAASFFAGIGWAAGTHAVWVLDSSGHVKTQFIIAHSAAGFASLIQRPAHPGDPAGTPVAIGPAAVVLAPAQASEDVMVADLAVMPR